MIWHSIPKGIKIKVLVCNLFAHYGDKNESQSASQECWYGMLAYTAHFERVFDIS